MFGSLQFLFHADSVLFSSPYTLASINTNFSFHPHLDDSHAFIHLALDDVLLDSCHYFGKKKFNTWLP